MELFSVSQKWKGCRYDPTTVCKHINYSFLISPVYRLLFLVIFHIMRSICWWLFSLLQPWSLYKPPITSIKTTVFFHAHWWGFKQWKKRTFLITVTVINTEAAIPGQTKDLSNLTSSSWEQLVSSPCFSILTVWSLTASASSPAVPHNHLTSSFSFPFDTLFLRGPNIFVGPINSVLSHGKSVMNGENTKMLFTLKHYLPAFPKDGNNVHYTTHDIWLGTLKSIINHKCSKIMDFIIVSVT